MKSFVLPLMIVMLALLSSCSTQIQPELSGAQGGTAEFSLFLKSSSDFQRSGLYVFLNGTRLGLVPSRGVITVVTSPGYGHLSLNVHESGFGFSSTREFELQLRADERKFLVYDQTTSVFIEVSEEKLAEFTVLYPPTEHEQRNVAKELGYVLIVPIALPGIVIFSVLTGQPLQ